MEVWGLQNHDKCQIKKRGKKSVGRPHSSTNIPILPSIQHMQCQFPIILISYLFHFNEIAAEFIGPELRSKLREPFFYEAFFENGGGHEPPPLFCYIYICNNISLKCIKHKARTKLRVLGATRPSSVLRLTALEDMLEERVRPSTLSTMFLTRVCCSRCCCTPYTMPYTARSASTMTPFFFE